MNRSAAEQLVGDLYEHCLARKPDAGEFNHWVDTIVIHGMTPETLVRTFYRCEEYQNKNLVNTVFPAGHYHSPVVDPPTVRDYLRRERESKPADISNIQLNLDEMRAVWNKNLSTIKSTPFTDNKDIANRYHYLGGPFSYGDAIILRMM